TAPDQLFQPLNPLLGPASAQPPANIAILPLATFAARVAPALPALASVAGTSAVPGAQSGTQWQVQAQLDLAALSGSPAKALQQATQVRNLAALGTAERDRRNLALLRARGARRRELVWLAALESLALGLVAGPLGTGFAFAALHFTGADTGAGSGRLLVTLAISIALAAAGAAAARLATG